MSITPSDIQLRLSGGASNTAAAASLGGAMSATAAPGGIFDDVSASQAAAGSVEYRCFYVHNAHSTLTLDSAVDWMLSNTPSTSTTVEIGLGTSALNGTEQTVADEATAPSGVTFVPAASKGAGLALGSIPAGQHRAIWFRRTVTAGAGATPADTFTNRVEGETV